MTNEMLTEKYTELDERVTRHTEQIKTCFNQIADLKTLAKSVQNLALSMQAVVTGQEDLKNKVDRVSTDLEEIKERPAKRWDSVLSVAISVIVTAIITYVLTATGLK